MTEPRANKARQSAWRSGRGLIAIGFICGAVAVSAMVAASGSSTYEVQIDMDRTVPRAERLMVGVATHFGIGGEYGYDPVKSTEKLKELGVDSYRDDLGWGGADADGSGRAVTVPAKLAQFVAMVPQRPLLILTAPHPNVDGGKAPRSPAARAAFGRFAASAVKTTAPSRPIYEIWNEWNMNAEQRPAHQKGEGDPSDARAAANYAPLAVEASAAIRKADPSARILVGAAGVDTEWDWVSGIVRRGVLSRACLLYTSPSPRDKRQSRMPSSA